MQKLNDSSEEFRYLFGLIPQMIFIATAQGQTLYLNQQWYDYTGFKIDIDLDNMNNVIHPDDVAAIHKVWVESSASGKTWVQEYRIRRHDGVYRWHLGRSVPDKDTNGVIRRWVGTITDIEEQKNIESILQDTKESLEVKVSERTKELTQANAFLDTVIENIPNMIFVKDAKDLKFVRFNRAGEELIGVPRENLIGKGDFDFFPPTEAIAFQEKDRAVLAGNKVVDIPEEPISTATGVRTLHTKKLPVHDSFGVPRYLLGISEDVTELKKIEKERLQFLEASIEKKESEKTTERFKFLSEASALLGSTLDYEVTLTNLTNLCVPAIADWCSVELLQADQSLKQIAVAHQNPEKVKWAWELRDKYPPDPNALTGPPNVVKTGRSEIMAEISSDLLTAAAIDEEHLKIINSIGFR